MYKPVIGLEIHVELKTQSKMFCQCSADYFGKRPNSNTCPACLGLPGALPVPNKKAVVWTQLIGKALNCRLNQNSKFDRKHYFYPDLPKGYQISQYDEPLCSQGYVEINQKRFRIHRVHLEEDTGKLIHSGADTLVDFNRSGVPLVEIVTEPDFDNAEDVKRFLEELHTIIRYLGVSDADMEKGSMRMEPNISLNQEGQTELPKYKVEVKNINSFRFVKQAIEYELERQQEILECGEIPVQETRGFDEKKQSTYSQRSKEEAHDYRYFPEPDIPPMTFSRDYLDSIKVPELPEEKMERYVKEFEMKYQDAFVLTRELAVADFFEAVNSKFKMQNAKLQLKIQNLGQTIANLIINKKISIDLPVEEFVKKAAELLQPKKTDEKLLADTIKHLIESNPKVVEDYKKGKVNAVMFLVGQVMRGMKGQADAKIVRKQLENELKKM